MNLLRVPKYIAAGFFLLTALVAPGKTPDTLPLDKDSNLLPEPVTPSCKEPVNINFFGDVYINGTSVKPSAELFAGVRPLFSWAHFNVANFEGVVTRSEERAFPTYPFALKIHPSVPSLLASLGITHVTRANNHSMDYGIDGLNSTTKALDAVGIQWAGVGQNLEQASKPMTLEAKGIKIAVFSYTTTLPEEAWASATTPGVAVPYVKTFKEAVLAAKTNHDFVVVVFHWGQELMAAVRPHQTQFANLALESGADFVAGHHAHVAQAIEQIGEKTIAYGLGNFVFTSYSPNAVMGLIAHAEFCKAKETGSKNSVRVAFTPINTLNSRTKFVTTPYSLKEFLPHAKHHQAQGFFPLQTTFFLPEMGKPMSLEALLKLAN